MDQVQQERIKQQIEQMTGSVRMLSEKEAFAVTDQLVREQMGREETYNKRENFLAGRGYTISARLSERITQARVGEPIEKKPEDKAQKKMNRKIRKQYQASKKQLSRDEREQRRFYAQDEKYSFIRTQSFATGYQYDILADAKKWMTENPEAYAQNKEAVDAMYKDLYIADEAYGALSRESRYYVDAYEEVRSDRAMAHEVDRRVTLLHDRQSFIQTRIQTLSDGLKSLLRGEQVDDIIKETMQEYKDIGPTEQQQREKAVYVEGAQRFGTYAERLRQALIPEIIRQRVALEERMGWKRSTPEQLAEYAKDVYPSAEGRVQNVANPEDAEQVARVAKVIVYRRSEATNAERSDLQADAELTLEVTQSIQEFSTGNLDAVRRVMGDNPLEFMEKYRNSDDLLLRDRDQFEMIAQATQHVSDLMKTYKVVSDGRVGDETIREAYLRERQITFGTISAQGKVLYELARKARFLSLIRAWQAGALTADVITEPDRYGVNPNLPEDELVKKVVERAERQLAAMEVNLDRDINEYKAAAAAAGV